MILVNFENYLCIEKKYSPHTAKAYLNDVKEFSNFLNEKNKKSLKEVAYADIRSWIVFLVENSLSNRSVNRKIASLKAFYHYLLHSLQIEKSPLLQHSALKIEKKIITPFSEKEVNKVIDEMNFNTNTFEGIRNKLVCELLYATGIRRAELLNLTLQNIDIKQRFIKVIGKRNKERVIPLVTSVVQTLEKYLHFRSEILSETTDFLFLTKKGKKMYPELAYRIINLYFSGVTNKQQKSPHTLRHAFATHLLDNGAELNSVKELLGHTSLSATQVYTHSSLSELKKQYNKHPRVQKEDK